MKLLPLYAKKIMTYGVERVKKEKKKRITTVGFIIIAIVGRVEIKNEGLRYLFRTSTYRVGCYG